MMRASVQCRIVLLVAGLLVGPLQASIIAPANLYAIPQHVIGSGNGTVDLRMFTYSGGEIPNSAGTFNGDNANNTLPQSGGSDTDAFSESYVITAGELKAWYTLNYPLIEINELVLLLDLNETGGGAAHNSLDRLDVVLNPTSIGGTPNPSGDVSSAEQAAINQVYSGGTLIAYLDPQPAANLPINSQGAGFADYAIFTGINPFALNDDDVLLFNISMSLLNDGAEEIFLSGRYYIPEPAAMLFLGLGSLVLLARSRR